MASGLSVTATGLTEAQRLMADMAARARDLTVPMKVFGAELEKRTDDAFAQSRSQLGVPFAPLAESTRLGRKGARKLEAQANRRSKSGALTKGAQAKRTKYSARGLVVDNEGRARVHGKPLVDTGRARASQRARADASGMSWSAVGYLGPHMTGALIRRHGKKRGGYTIRLPKRNVAGFELEGGGWRLMPHLQQLLAQYVASYVRTGQVTGGAG